jgi:energy-coupling factor transporter ATP-binding protein EcfA2
MVSLLGLEKSFAPGQGVFGVDLEVAEGKVLALLGPSGSGKNTLLNLVAGLLFPDRGRILLGGREVTRWPPERRGWPTCSRTWASGPTSRPWSTSSWSCLGRTQGGPGPSGAGGPGGPRGAQAPGALRRPAAAGGPGPGLGP